jgi:hypothetical protein
VSDQVSYPYQITGIGTYKGEERCIQVSLWGNLKERDDFENLDVDGRIILKLILNKLVGRPWIGLIWLRIWTSCR